MLKIENLTKIFGKGTINEMVALDGVDFHAEPGDFVTIIGSNGAGKSTLMNSIAGVFPVDSGTIVLNGKDISGLPEHKRARMIGRVFQDPLKGTAFDMTIEENLILGAYTEKDSQRQKQNMQRVMELFPILRERRRQTAGTLSGGEQQMLAIARALMGNPRMLLLDEPSMGLSHLLTEQVFDAVKSLNDQGTTILLVEQNAYDAMEISHRTYIMENGVITREGKSSELMRDPAIKQAYLGGD